MKAAVQNKYGGPEVVEVKEVPKPVPGNTEVLIKIIYSTVNRNDTGFRKPEYFVVRFFNGFFTPRFKTMGSELAGIVEAHGKDVKTFKTGDKVFGLSTKKFSTHAEYITLDENSSITRMPSNMEFKEAAGVCDGMMLAINLLKKINFSTKKKILVNGASGSIGSACVQMAKYFGAEVTAVCKPEFVTKAKELGADKVIDYFKEDFTKLNYEFDAVLDAVGKSSFFKCRKILKEDGIYIGTEFGFMAQNVWLPLLTKIIGSRRVYFPLPSDNKKEIELFKTIIESGSHKAVIDRTYILDEIQEAHRYVEAGHKNGNVLLKISEE